MPSPQPIVSDAAPAAVGPYVHAVRHGDVLYCSGSLPLDPATGELDNADLAAETRRSLANLEAVCASAGTSLDRALRMTIYTTRLDGFAEINEVYAGAFPGNVPARTTVGVAALPKDARVEIDAIVAIGAGDE
ncbi:Rid family detoxifying hydrolase [Nocardioides sp. LHD-245]|uniref:Rid family detoxifying hydrolase n=1 Tax=Nocardioides sp. LHD-245 TaxID=3051387 RepID=UPI0027DF3AFC|nr:Rid family detoxifying hydrolase [Nocardioides sp. LHD-245]